MALQLADQFRGINWRDPGTLPALPKGVMLTLLVVAVLALSYFFIWQGQWDQLEAGQAEETKLKDTYKLNKGQAINLDAYRAQVREIETSFGTLLKQLPSKSQMESLLVEINQAGLGRGLQFELFKPAPQESTREFYAELPITLKVIGGYHDMGAFAGDIAQLSRIVTLNDMALSVSKDGGLVLDTTARTFRYLDEEELAEQKRSANAAKAAKK